MDNKIGTFTKQSFPKTSVKLSPEEVRNRLDHITQEFVDMNGPIEGWDERMKECLGELRMYTICKQTTEVVGLERQYESRNSIDD